MYRRARPSSSTTWRRTGRTTEFGYKDFLPHFRMERFDPRRRGSRCSERAGAQFVVPVAEHHDGYAMYDDRALALEGARRSARSAT